MPIVPWIYLRNLERNLVLVEFAHSYILFSRNRWHTDQGSSLLSLFSLSLGWLTSSFNKRSRSGPVSPLLLNGRLPYGSSLQPIQVIHTCPSCLADDAMDDIKVTHLGHINFHFAFGSMNFLSVVSYSLYLCSPTFILIWLDFQGFYCY